MYEKIRNFCYYFIENKLIFDKLILNIHKKDFTEEQIKSMEECDLCFKKLLVKLDNNEYSEQGLIDLLTIWIKDNTVVSNQMIQELMALKKELI